MCSRHGLFGLSMLFTILTLLMLLLSFSTDHWVEYIVQRKSIQDAVSDSSKQRGLLGNKRHYYSRNRGLFQTCCHGNVTRLIGSLPDEDTNDNCVIERGYEWSGTPRKDAGSWGSYYQIRKHCMRCQVIFMCLAMSLIIITCIIVVLSCIGTRKGITQIYARNIHVVTILFAIVALLIVVSMVLFHVIRDLERNKIWGEPFEYYWSSDKILQDHTRVVFGYSYIFSWVAFGFSILSTFLFCATSIRLKYDEDFANIDQKENLINESNCEKEAPTNTTLYTNHFQSVPFSPVEQPIISPLGPFSANHCVFSVEPLPQSSAKSPYLDKIQQLTKIPKDETYATSIVKSSDVEQKNDNISLRWPPNFAPLVKQRPPLPIPFKASSGTGEGSYATFISTNVTKDFDTNQEENILSLYTIPDKKNENAIGWAPIPWLYGDETGTMIFEQEEEPTQLYRISI